MNPLVKNNKIYFAHLDVVRFLAAFMVTIAHAYEAWNGWFGEIKILRVKPGGDFTLLGGFLDRFIKNLGIGVEVFFLISGFLITYLLLEEKKRYNKIHIGKFMIRRSLRIWPLYFFLIALAPFLVEWVGKTHPNYIYHILFWGNFDIIAINTWPYPFAHFWSICIEEHFYLVWPFIIAFIPKDKLLIAFISIISFSIAFRIYEAIQYKDSGLVLYLHTFSKIDTLVIGAIGAYFYSENKFNFNLTKSLRILIITILIVSLCIEPVFTMNSPFLAGFKKYFYTGLIAILLMDYNLNKNFKHIMRKKSFAHYLGKISYGIYMYGNILLIIVVKKIMWRFHITNMWAFFGITFVLTIIIPIISYELFEKQILRLNKFFKVIKTDR